MKQKVDRIAVENPENAYVANSAGRFYLQAAYGRPKASPQDASRALGYAERAVALARGQKDRRALVLALRTRGIAHYQAGDYPAAASDAETILGLDPKDPVGDSLFRLLRGREGPSPAKAEARPASGGSSSEDLTPEEKAALNAWAQRRASEADVQESFKALRVEDFSAARKAADEALRKNPRNFNAYLQRAMAEINLKQWDPALSDASKAIEIGFKPLNKESPGYALWSTAFNVRSLALLELGRPRQALDEADQAAAVNPKDAQAFWTRAQVLEALGRPAARILQDYQRAASLDPQLGDSYRAALRRLSGGEGAGPETASGKVSLQRQWLILGLAALLMCAVLLAARLSRPVAVSPPAPLDPVLALEDRFNRRFASPRVIGQGGMGVVYEAQDKVLGRMVAVKRLQPEIQADPRERERFIQEAQTVAALRHPNILEIYDILQGGQETLLIFEFIKGKNLSQLIRESPNGRLPHGRLSAFLEPVAAALDYAHARGVIHRDLKPSNIMMDEEGRMKVMDFGLARSAVPGAVPLTQSVAGTPQFMPPEQQRGRAVRESDLFALGVCVYEMLTGRYPFEGTTGEIWNAIEEGRFADPRIHAPDLPDSLNSFFRKAFAPRPEERFHSSGELLDACLSCFPPSPGA